MTNVNRILLVSLAALSLCACGGKGTSHDTDDGGGTQVANPVINQGKSQPKNPCKPGQPDGMVGVYNGYLKNTGTDGKTPFYVPLQLQILPRQDASGTSCALRATLRAGVLGGVTVETPNTSCDQKGNFSATFSNTANGSTSELRGVIQCGQFVSATFRGKSTYNDIVLGSDQKNLFDGRQVFNYKKQTQTLAAIRNPKTKKKGAQVALTYPFGFSFTSRTSPMPSNETGDLPLLPNLTAAASYSGFSGVPVTADATVYSTLEGKLEISYAKYSTLKFDNVGLASLDQQDTQSPELVGTATSTASVKAIKLVPGDLPSTPYPSYYHGTFRVPGGLPSEAIANFIYDNTMGINPMDNFFPSFPQMSLKLTTCGNVGDQIQFKLTGLNAFTGKATFTYTTPSNDVYVYDASFTEGFSSLSGKIFSDLDNDPTHKNANELELDASSTGTCSN